jgi:hypothetical protein
MHAGGLDGDVESEEGLVAGGCTDAEGQEAPVWVAAGTGGDGRDRC